MPDNVVPIDADAARLLARRRVYFRWFVALLVVAYVSVLIPVLVFTPLPPAGPFALLAALVILAEHRFVLFGDETSMSASIIVIVASVFVFADSSPLAGPLLIGSLGGLYLPHLRRGCLHKTAFNTSSMGIAALTSAGIGLLMVDYTTSPLVVVGIVSAVTSSYWCANNVLVAGYLTTANGYRFTGTTRYLLTSETDVLGWTGVACVGVLLTNGNVVLGIACIAVTTAVRVATSTSLLRRLREAVPHSHAGRDRRLLGWFAAISILRFSGAPRQADVVFAFAVVLLAERHPTTRRPIVSMGLPVIAITTLTAPSLAAAVMMGLLVAFLLARRQSDLAWSTCVAIGTTTWVLVDRISAESLHYERPTTILMAVLIPTAVSFALYGFQVCRLAAARDPWVLLGFTVPTRSDLLIGVALGVVAVACRNTVALVALLTVALVAVAALTRISARQTSQDASR